MGRKFKLSAAALITLLVSLGIFAQATSLLVIYPEFVTGVLGILAIYCGGNVSNKFVTSKNNNIPKESSE